jgi:hypothetical protein
VKSASSSFASRFSRASTSFLTISRTVASSADPRAAFWAKAGTVATQQMTSAAGNRTRHLDANNTGSEP